MNAHNARIARIPNIRSSGISSPASNVSGGVPAFC
jgi:hypothetical protein